MVEETKAQLAEEVKLLRDRVAELEREEVARRRAEIALRENMEWLQDILSSLHESAIIIYDRDGNITALWGTAELDQRYGIRAADTVGKSLREILPSDQVEQKLTQIRHVFDTGKRLLVDEPVSFPGGDFWHNTSFSPIWGANGAVVAVVGFIRDVTERRRAEEALRQSEERYQTLLARLPEGVGVSLAEEIIYANQPLLELIGCTEEQLLGCAPEEFAVLEDQERARNNRFAMLEGKLETDVSEFTMVRVDGTTIPVEISSRVIQYQEQRAVLGIVRDITRRKETEQALRDNEERFELAVRGTDAGIWDWDSRTNDVYFSPRWKSMLGYAEDEITRSFSEWESRLHPDDRERAFATLQDYLQGRSSEYELEHRLRHKDGSYRWILARGAIVRDKQGKPYRMVGSHLDITERKRAEEQLRRTHALLQTIVDGTKDCVFLKDSKGRYQLINPAAASTMILVRAEDALGKDDAAIFPEDLARKFQEQDREVMATGKPLYFEDAFGERFFETLETPQFDDQGNVVGVVGIAREITERKQWEEALRENEERLRQVTENIREVFWITSPDYHEMIYVSPGFEEIWGRTCEELYKHPKLWAEVIHEKDGGRVTEALERDIGRGQFDQEYRIVRPDGTVRWIRDRAFPVRDESGATYRFAGIAEDITDRKKAEQTIHDRDAELAHATRLATMGEIIAEIAHELNQPLYAISNFVSVCEHLAERHDEKHRRRLAEGLGEIRKNTDRAGGIIRRLREFIGHEEPKRQLVGIDEVIDTSLQILDFEFQEREVSVRVEKPSEESLLQVHVDPVQIEQVLVNLLRNACDAMNDVRAENRRITVRLLSSADSVEVAVEDCGPGVLDEHASKIFDTYFTTKKDGMGMGLSIAKRIVEHHGGKLWYTANTERGAVFHFSLPLEIEGSSD